MACPRRVARVVAAEASALRVSAILQREVRKLAASSRGGDTGEPRTDTAPCHPDNAVHDEFFRNLLEKGLAHCAHDAAAERLPIDASCRPLDPQLTDLC